MSIHTRDSKLQELSENGPKMKLNLSELSCKNPPVRRFGRWFPVSLEAHMKFFRGLFSWMWAGPDMLPYTT